MCDVRALAGFIGPVSVKYRPDVLRMERNNEIRRSIGVVDSSSPVDVFEVSLRLPWDVAVIVK